MQLGTTERYTQKIDELRSELVSVSRELTEAISSRDRAKEDVHNAQITLVNVSNQIADKQTELLDLSVALDNKKNEHASFTNKKQQQISELEQSISEKEEIEAEFNVTQEDVNHKKAELSALHKRYLEKEDDVAFLEEKLTKLTSKLSQVEKEIGEAVNKDKQRVVALEEREEQLKQDQSQYASARKTLAFYARKFERMHKQVFKTDLPKDVLEIIDSLK